MLKRYPRLVLSVLAISTLTVVSACSPASGPIRAAAAEATARDLRHVVTSGTVTESALADAAADNADWVLPGKSYANNRYTGLGDISPRNVAQLRKAWVTKIRDDGQQEASPLAWHGQLYISTPHDSVLSLDGTSGKLVWQHPYTVPYVINNATSRGVGLADGRVFVATQDCRVMAMDAATGKLLWNVPGCPNQPNNNTQNNYFSIASYVYNGAVVLGTSGGDYGNVGRVVAFDTRSGQQRWTWQTIKPDTWPGDSSRHGGGAVWGGMAIDPATKTIFVAPGNPGPDLTSHGREGKDLYTDSVVALDVSGPRPRVKWYYQLLANDTHDGDPAMGSVLFDGRVHGTMRHLLAIGNKIAELAIFDRTNGKLIYKLGLDDQTGIFSTSPTAAGTRACPSHFGGVLWNGGAYDPATNAFIVPSTEECTTWKLDTNTPKWIPGQLYSGGPLPKRGNSTGKLTSVNIASGKISWVRTFPFAGEGGALITRSGLVFSTDLGGDLFAIDAKDGKILWKTNTGSSNIAPITAYEANGIEYIVLLSGEAGVQHAPNLPSTHGSVLTAYSLGPVSERHNSGADQQILTQSSALQPASVGSAPYSQQQVAAGERLYATSCLSCHGADLQGVSAPALTGAGIAHSKLNLSQFQATVTKQMPLNVPGSLKPSEYASIIAYILSYDCVSRAGTSGDFPTETRSEFKTVVFGGRSCRLRATSHE